MKVSKKTLQEIKQGFALAGYNPELATDFIKGIRKIGKNLGYSNPDEFTAQTLNLIKLESDFNPKAKNSFGYQGFIQFSPNNAKTFGYNPDPIKQLGSIESYLRSNKRTMDQTFGDVVKNRDRAENGSVLLTSVLTGPSSRSLVDPSVSKTKDAYGTDNSKYYKNIRAGLQNYKQADTIIPEVGIEAPKAQNSVVMSHVEEQPLNQESTLKEQFAAYTPPAPQQTPEMPSPSEDMVAQVIKMMEQQQTDIGSLQQNQQQSQQVAQANMLQNRELLAQNRLQQEEQLKSKAKEAQLAMDNQRQQLFGNMVLKDDPSLNISADYESPQIEMPTLNVQHRELKFGRA